MNPYSHAPLIVGLIFLGLSIATLDRKRPTAFSYSILSFLSAVWHLSWALLFNLQPGDAASFVSKVGHIAIVCLPFAVFNNLCANLQISFPKTKRAILAATLGFLTINLASNLIINGVSSRFFGPYPLAGLLHPLFLAFVSAVGCFNIFAIYRDQKLRAASRSRKVFYAAILIYPFAGIDFLVNYGIEIYPWGFLFLFIYLILNLYSLILQNADEITELNWSLEEKVKVATRALEEQTKELVSQASLASVGTLAGGVAHEINNAMNFIKLSLPIIKNALVASGSFNDQLKEIFDLLVKGTDRSVAIVKALKGQSTVSSEEFKEIDFKSEIDDVCLLLKEKRDAKKIKINIQVSHRRAHLHSVLFNQVIMNLLANSIDAIEAEGDVSIWIEKRENEFKITFSDSGPGIPVEIREKIFNPHFTTKRTIGGTGLGLFILKFGLEKVGGLIELQGETGSTFVVTLPSSSHKKHEVA